MTLSVLRVGGHFSFKLLIFNLVCLNLFISKRSMLARRCIEANGPNDVVKTVISLNI